MYNNMLLLIITELNTSFLYFFFEKVKWNQHSPSTAETPIIHLFWWMGVPWRSLLTWLFIGRRTHISDPLLLDKWLVHCTPLQSASTPSSYNLSLQEPVQNKNVISWLELLMSHLNRVPQESKLLCFSWISFEFTSHFQPMKRCEPLFALSRPLWHTLRRDTLLSP